MEFLVPSGYTDGTIVPHYLSVHQSIQRPSTCLFVSFHIFNFCSRTPGADPGQDKNRSQGIPFFKKLLLQTGKATATNQMHSNDLEACGMKCCCFWFHSKVKFSTRFLRLFGLSHFALFQCNFYRFLCSKVLNLHLFCIMFLFVSENILMYKRFKFFKNFNELFMYLFC